MTEKLLTGTLSLNTTNQPVSLYPEEYDIVVDTSHKAKMKIYMWFLFHAKKN